MAASRRLEPASLFPNFFGFRHAFDPVHYAKNRNDFTTTFRGLNDELVDMEREIPAAEIGADHEEFKKLLHHPRLPRARPPSSKPMIVSISTKLLDWRWLMGRSYYCSIFQILTAANLTKESEILQPIWNGTRL